MINPDDFIISRKRKKYKFAKFANSPLCFEFSEWKKQPVDVIEVGAGNGMFSVEFASRHPELQVVAFDIKGDRLQKGAYEAEKRKLQNIRFLRARADQLSELFTTHSVQQIWLTFPDPFPKKSSSGRRLTHPTFLSYYQSLLVKDGTFYCKHDSREFFVWTLEQLVAQKWALKELSFDLHESELAEDYKIMTSYEKRWISEGSVTNFVSAQHG